VILPVTEPSHAVFLSYASQDAEAVQKICEALRAAGIEVWFDKSELRGGDVWDRRIHDQIHNCRLFIPVISATTEARDEGYFRREWGLATDRTRDIAEKRAFLIPVVIDDTLERGASVPDKFHQIQWTRLLGGVTPPAFVTRAAALLGASTPLATANGPAPAPVSAVPTHTPNRRALWMPLGLATLLIVVGGAWFALRHSGLHGHADSGMAPQSQPAITEKSIAVLPFVDLSEMHDQEYFADGMAEEILDILAKIPQLTVIGRTSSFQFKGRTEDLRTIGEMLGTAYVVEGSVRKAGARIRVTAQLVDAQSGAHVWSETYDKDFGDVLTLQDEIATAIARALQLTISAHDAHPLHSAHATEAYTLYLRGKLALDKFSANSLLEAQSAFLQALELDPTLLPAAEGLALTYLARGQNENDITGREAWEQARSAARKALQISASSATAHGVLGYVAGYLDFDWPTAEREFQKAFALSPNAPYMLLNAASLAARHGDFEEALRRINASVVLDPLSAGTHQMRGLLLYLSGDYAAAESALRKSIALNPEIDGSYMYLGFIQLQRNQPEAALKEFVADPESSARDAGIALVSHAIGKKAESDAALARVVDAEGNIWAYGVALIHAYRGERDQAFAWLEKSRDTRDGDLLFVLGDPLLKPLHDDPRWAALMKSMNLAN
jgi:adenylate cyclase